MTLEELTILFTSGMIGIVYPSVLWYVVTIMYGGA